VNERTEIGLPVGWVAAAAALAAAAWAAVPIWGGRSTPWLGITVGVAVGLSLFAVGAWAQRVRLDGRTLSGNVLLRRSVDLDALTHVRVGGNPLPGGARSNDVAVLQDDRGGRVTIPLSNFPRASRARIAGLLREPVRTSGVDLDDETRVFLEGG
jgi:hypothetical protein